MGDLTEFPTRPKPVMLRDERRVTPENFWEKGRMLIASSYPENAPIIQLGTPECEAWATYFAKHLRWKPWALRALQAGNIQGMTVPAQWPEWFDTSYSAAQ